MSSSGTSRIRTGSNPCGENRGFDRLRKPSKLIWMVEESGVAMQPDTEIPAETLQIDDLETLKVVADPRRKQLIDLLRQDAATVKELAATLHVSPKSLYYHVNLLQKHGLIRVVDTRLVSGITEKRYRTTAYLFLFNELGITSDSEQAGRAHEGIESIFAMTVDDLRLGLESGAIDASDSAPAAARLSFSWSLLALSSAQRDELDRRLCSLFEEYSSTDSPSIDDQAFRYMYMVFPTIVRGGRPATPAKDRTAGEGS
jgi:DNA-binding transcriptional ArsR family regulator